MFVRLIQIPVFLAAAGIAQAGNYLTENPNETFADLYARLGIVLTEKIVRDPQVWSLLEQLNREQCDQRSITDLGLLLDKRGYRREAAESLYNFVRTCGAPISALRRSINLFLVLTDYPKAVEVADDFVRRAPTDHDAYYLRGIALQGAGDFRRATDRLRQCDRALWKRQKRHF